jgi:hypothetical protein
MRIEKLLFEITIKDAWVKFYSDKTKFPILKGDENLFNKINQIYTDNVNNFNKGLFTWLYNLINNNQLKEEDFYKAKEYIRLFNKYVNKIPKENRDITKYKTLPDLYEIIKDFEGNENIATSKKDEVRNIKKNEINKVFENDEWLIMVPLTEQASCIIGKGTQWCTAADNSNNMFSHYSSQGPLYVIVNKKDNTKYQLHFESNQLMDERDRPIPATHFFDYILEDAYDVIDFFQGANENFWDFILETSAEDQSDGGYSEIFNEALNNGSEYAITEALKTLRAGRDEDSVRTGFMYEKDPSNIDEWEIRNLFEYHINDEGFNDIIEHLNSIGYDFDDTEIGPHKDYIDAVKKLGEYKLGVDKTYKIDKGRNLRIVKVNFGANDDKYYKISITDPKTSNDIQTGDVTLETLLNYIHQGQLFENKEFIKKLIREELFKIRKIL